MTLTEGFVKDAVFIDFGAEILYGSDQCYVSYPCRFPTVGFSLMATNGLFQIADRIRKDTQTESSKAPQPLVIGLEAEALNKLLDFCNTPRSRKEMYSVDNGYLGIFLSHEIIKTKLMEVPHVKTQITRRMGRNH